MVAWDRGATPAERFRAHAEDRTDLYAVTLRSMADDWEAGGPVRSICAGSEDAPEGSAVQLRLLAGVFRLVLDGRADALRPWYACLGGTAPPATVWPVLHEVLAAQVPELRSALGVAPQTNEVGRSAALLVGLTALADETGVRRVRLLELGASAGLNLLLDRFRLTGPGWTWGPAGSPVQLDDAVEGPFAPAALTVVDGAGCDLAPVDAGADAGARLLTSFVWPFHLHRHARLAGALAVARQHPVRVEQAGAADWLRARLEEQVSLDSNPDGDAIGDGEVLTVVWHSVSRLYWSPVEVAAVDAVLADHGRHRRVARVSMEYEDAASGTGGQPVLTTTLHAPGAGPVVRRLGTVHHHGLPVRLEVPVGLSASPGPGGPG